MHSRLKYAAIGLSVGLFCNAAIALAWTGPSASPPSGNVGAPINVGATAQIKSGNLGVGNFTAFGNALLSGLGVGTGSYLNFDYTNLGTSGSGSAGYGIRDNAGTLEFKNLGGSWASLQSVVNSLCSVCSGGGAATSTIDFTTAQSLLQGPITLHLSTPTYTYTLPETLPNGTWAVLLNVYYLHTGGADHGYLSFIAYQEGTTAGETKYQTTYSSSHYNDYYNSDWVQLWVPYRQSLASKKLVVQVTSSYNTNAGNAYYIYYGGRAAGGNMGVTAPGTGSGTANYVSKFLTSTSIGNSVMYDTGAAVGINTTAPSYPLDVRGNVSGSYVAGFINTGTHGAVAQGTQYGFVGYSTSGGYGVLGQSNCGTSACAGVIGQAGSYYGYLGRADGYSYVGYGALYNSGTIYGNAFIYLSDARLKKNVETLDTGLVTLMKLRPVSFTWKDSAPNEKGGKADIGFIAQELEKVLPDVVHTDPASGYKEVDYPRLVPILVSAVQKQQEEIESLKSRIELLEAKKQ